MSISKAVVDKALVVVVSVAAATLSILVAQGVISADLAAQISSALAVLTGSYHTGGYVAAKSTPAVPPVSDGPLPQFDVADPAPFA